MNAESTPTVPPSNVETPAAARPLIIKDNRLIAMGWLFWVTFALMCITVFGIPLAILWLIIAIAYQNSSAAAKNFDQQVREATAAGREYKVKRTNPTMRIIIWGVVLLICIGFGLTALG